MSWYIYSTKSFVSRGHSSCVYNIIYRTPLEHSDSCSESSLYFGVDEIISFQTIIGGLDKMAVAKLGRQWHRSLDSYLKSPREDLPWALALSKQTTSLPLSPQSPLDHVTVFIKPWKLCFGDLDLHSPFNIFSLVYTEVVLGRVQQPINALITP